jgi:hypothetical protein
MVGVSSQSTNMIVMKIGNKVKLLCVELIKPKSRMAFMGLEV